MVELATFRMFHRAPLPRQAEIPVASPPPEMEAADESLADRFTDELGAHRQAMPADTFDTDAWDEGEVAASPDPEPPPVHPAESAPAEHVPPAPALLPATPVHNAGPAEPPAVAELASDEPVPPVETPPHEVEPAAVPTGAEAVAPEHAPEEPPVHEAALVETPAAAETASAVEEEPADTWHESEPVEVAELVTEPEPSPVIAEAPDREPVSVYEWPADPEPAEATMKAYSAPETEGPDLDEPMDFGLEEPEPPVSIFEFLRDPQPRLDEAPVPELVEMWPVEPPAMLVDEAMLPIEPPPIEPPLTEPSLIEPSLIEPSLIEPPLNETVPLPTELWEPSEEYHSDSLALDYRLLGLASPVVCKVVGRLGDAAPTPLSLGRVGIYRPDGFRPAPWSGFGYDVSPDGRTGLGLGTRVLTGRGEIPVEDLVPGDTALALRGPSLLPILWIGRGVASLPAVEIAPGAFGPDRPSRTLRVGAEHSIFIDTMPMAARDLVNGDTVRNVASETVELFQVDVGYGEVLLTENIPLASGGR